MEKHKTKAEKRKEKRQKKQGQFTKNAEMSVTES